jgi:hypothetical protein
MKISKIFAGMSAMAIAATMAVSASAATDVTTDGKYPGDWSTPNFSDGNNYLSYDYLEEYKDTGVTIEVDYTLEDGFDYYLLAPCNANGWAKLYQADASYITGVDAKEDVIVDDVASKWACMQNDGYVILQNVDGSTKFTFTLSGAAIQYLYDNAGDGEDAETGEAVKWGGLVFQTYGVNVTKVVIGADAVDTTIQASSDSSNDSSASSSSADSTGSSSSSSSSSAASTTSTATKTNTTATSTAATTTTTSTASDNTNASTGATAGIALAGLALAGAAVVVSKRK